MEKDCISCGAPLADGWKNDKCSACAPAHRTCPLCGAPKSAAFELCIACADEWHLRRTAKNGKVEWLPRDRWPPALDWLREFASMERAERYSDKRGGVSDAPKAVPIRHGIYEDEDPEPPDPDPTEWAQEKRADKWAERPVEDELDETE